MRKLNLGSGPNSARGWINYDWGLMPLIGKFRLTSLLVKFHVLDKSYDWKWPKIELVDVRNGLPDEDSTVDYIYCSHVLEHFDKETTLKILKECRRVLKNKGIIRVVLPDLKIFVKNYKGAESFNREFYGFDKDLYIGTLAKIKRLFIRGHQWMYDKNSARQLLKEVGFKNIRTCSFRKGFVPNLESLDIEQHHKISLYLEAADKY